MLVENTGMENELQDSKSVCIHQASKSGPRVSVIFSNTDVETPVFAPGEELGVNNRVEKGRKKQPWKDLCDQVWKITTLNF